MFHHSAALFYCESCLSGSSFEATVCALPSPQDRKSVLKIHRIVALQYMCYLSRCRLSFRCSMSKCVMQSAVWDSEAQQDMSVQRPFCPDFPCKSVMHIISGNLFYSLSKDTFSHSSVITAYSQAVICTTCVWKHLGVFLPIILARDESHLQPCSSSNKSFLSEHKDDWWARHLRHTHWLDKEWSAAKQTGQ